MRIPRALVTSLGLLMVVACTQAPPSEAVTSSPTAEIPALPGHGRATWDPTTWASLRGFIGPGYVQQLSGQAQVLQPTVVVSTSGTWSAQGLVRNETPTDAGLVVTAHLLAADGSVLATVSGASPVGVARPGEPIPFSIGSDTPRGSVKDVTWEVDVRAIDVTVIRDFQILEFWRVPWGDRAAERFDPPSDPPYPFVLYGAVSSFGEEPVASIEVVAAWVNAEGQVEWITTARVGVVPNDSEMSAVAPDLLRQGQQGDYYLVLVEKAVGKAASVGELTPMFWATGLPA